jgi:hypothetical protein
MPGGRFNPVNSLRFVDPMVNECFEITGNLALTVVLRVRSHGESTRRFVSTVPLGWNPPLSRAKQGKRDGEWAVTEARCSTAVGLK